MVLNVSDDVVRVEPENVPEALRQADRWCVWKRSPDKSGKLTKKPMRADRPHAGFSKTDTDQYRDFATAVKAYERHEHVDGIGFVTGGGIVAIDWDECCDDVTREILRPDVAEWLRRLNTYAEYSPSGRGIRAFLRGKLLGESITAKAAGIELYDDPNYVTVTGFKLPDSPDAVAEGGELLEELYAEAKAKQAEADERRKEAKEAKKAKKAAAGGSVSTSGAQSHRLRGDEAAGRLTTPSENGHRDVLALAEASASGDAVKALMAGQWESDYPTQSEAEFALANYLAFFAGPGGEAEVEQLMRSSRLNRDKFDNDIGGGRTYLSHTVAKAFADKAEFYSPRVTTAGKKAAELLLPNGMAGTGPAALNDSSTLTDVGLARRLVLEANGTLRYVREWRSWLAWDGKRWLHDDGLAAAHVAKQVSDRLWQEVAELSSERRGQVLTFVKASSSARGIEAAVKLARSEPGVVVNADELNRHAFLLNVANGTLNLETAELRPHSPADLLTHMASATFDASASCPTWKKFVADVTNGDKELAAFLQRSCGLALSGDVSEQVLWLHYGEGRNGKSTLLNVLTDLLGTYAGPAPMELLLVKGRAGREVETQFASLAGKRLVTTVEADCGVRFSEATVKLLTGGDTVLARRLYEDAWPVRPSWKLHVAANHKPLVRGTDEGIWRRLMLTPWLRRFEGQADDKGLKAKLLAELPGILNWCLAGFVQWRGQGLEPPEKVLAATKEYRGENDVLGNWMEEACVKEPHAVAEAAALYRAFAAWSEDRGEHPMTATAFGLRLEQLGYASERPSSGQWRFRTIRRGIGLLDLRRDGELA
jgi:putative DNA primase/helicase